MNGIFYKQLMLTQKIESCFSEQGQYWDYFCPCKQHGLKEPLKGSLEGRKSAETLRMRAAGNSSPTQATFNWQEK